MISTNSAQCTNYQRHRRTHNFTVLNSTAITIKRNCLNDVKPFQTRLNFNESHSENETNADHMTTNS